MGFSPPTRGAVRVIAAVLCALAGCGPVHLHLFELPGAAPIETHEDAGDSELDEPNYEPNSEPSHGPEIWLPPLPSEKAELFGRARRHT